MAAAVYLTTDANMATLDSELAGFRASDQRRDEFVSRLLEYVKSLEEKDKDLRDELENEKESRRVWQNKAGSWRGRHERLTQDMGKGGFTLALLDGDGAVFNDSLIAAGADGGSDAAHKLATEIKGYLQTANPAASHLPLVCQVFTNLEGLSKKLYAVGIVTKNSDLYQFVRAFNMAQPLFSIIDVGYGKELADHKLKETFRLYIDNLHCKHIILGGITHDYGYVANLNPYKHDRDTAERITLLDTWAGGSNYGNLGLQSFKAPSIFRDEPLPNKPNANGWRNTSPKSAPVQPVAPQPYPTAVQQAVSVLQPSSLEDPHPQLRAQTPPSKSTSPAAVTGPPSKEVPPVSSPASATPGSDALSWATVGKNGAPAKTISIAPTVKKERPYVVLNKDQERLDVPISKAKADFASLQERIRAHGKICNNYHLLGRCNDPYCDFKHAPAISEGEKTALRIKARQKSCYDLGACRDANCISGHVCPYGANCLYADCFYADTHGVDRTSAYKCYEDGRLEQFRGVVM